MRSLFKSNTKCYSYKMKNIPDENSRLSIRIITRHPTNRINNLKLIKLKFYNNTKNKR